MRLLPKRNIPILFAAFFIAFAAHGQKKEKVRGSRNVTVDVREINSFTSLEVEDNIEVFLVQGSRGELQIEADDNLHDAISIIESGGNLRIGVSKDVYGAKKLSVRITFTNDLKLITAKDDTHVTSLTDINLPDFTYKISGSSKVFSTIKAPTFTLMQNDKSKVDIRVSGQNTTIELNKTAQLKALVTGAKLKIDLYQKASANLEGEINDLRLRMDANTNLTAKSLTCKNADVVVEGNANATILAEARAVLEASGKTEIELFGEPKIEIRKLTDNATLRKRALK